VKGKRHRKTFPTPREDTRGEEKKRIPQENQVKGEQGRKALGKAVSHLKRDGMVVWEDSRYVFPVLGSTGVAQLEIVLRPRGSKFL